MITENEARMIGKAIKEEAEIRAVAIESPIERRAVCLKFAIETRANAFRTDTKASEDAADVLVAARLYDDFVSGRESAMAGDAGAAA